MKFTVINHDISIGNIDVLGLSSSGILLVGDSEIIKTSSIFDTPPESLIIGPLVPLAPE